MSVCFTAAASFCLTVYFPCLQEVSKVMFGLPCPFYRVHLCWFRLAKGICAQIKDRVRRSHAIFEMSLTRLEAHHSGRLQQTEKQRLSVRKEYAPRIARLALESRSLRDLILYGSLQLILKMSQFSRFLSVLQFRAQK